MAGKGEGVKSWLGKWLLRKAQTDFVSKIIVFGRCRISSFLGYTHTKLCRIIKATRVKYALMSKNTQPNMEYQIWFRNFVYKFNRVQLNMRRFSSQNTNMPFVVPRNEFSNVSSNVIFGFAFVCLLACLVAPPEINQLEHWVGQAFCVFMTIFMEYQTFSNKEWTMN